MKKRFYNSNVSPNNNKVSPKGKYIPPMIEEINVGDIGIKARTNSYADCILICLDCAVCAIEICIIP